ncbi:hypothetical protein EN35_36925 [Rhodococcus qingshengii]|nr:hypothetical protein EN35_36925 [Rhodococcus qingshengii]
MRTVGINGDSADHVAIPNRVTQGVGVGEFSSIEGALLTRLERGADLFGCRSWTGDAQLQFVRATVDRGQYEGKQHQPDHGGQAQHHSHQLLAVPCFDFGVHNYPP